MGQSPNKDSKGPTLIDLFERHKSNFSPKSMYLSPGCGAPITNTDNLG